MAMFTIQHAPLKVCYVGFRAPLAEIEYIIYKYAIITGELLVS